MCFVFAGSAQTTTNAVVNGAGWKRVAYSNATSGRGFGKITVFTTGGEVRPEYADVEWFKDYTVNAGISIKSNGVSAYWTDARITYDQDTTFIELKFTRAIQVLSLLSDNYGFNVAKLFTGILPEGKGTVRAEAKVGKLTIGNHLAVAFNGNVGIGTSAPSEKLAVNGTIRAKEIKVEAAPWPDYVFEEDYQLPSLKETEQFIKANKHLPEVPSAKEVEGSGVALGEMNALLLKKVEELTLHLIEKEKQIDTLRKEFNDFKNLMTKETK